MISDGILISNGFELSINNKKVKKYETVFENIQTSIQEDGMIVKIQLKKTPTNKQCNLANYSNLNSQKLVS